LQEHPGSEHRRKLTAGKKAMFFLATFFPFLFALLVIGELYLSRTAVTFDIAVSQAAFDDLAERADKNQQGRDPDSKKPHTIVFNQFGLRDKSPALKPGSREKPRILVVGDSFIENLGLPWEAGFVAQLEKHLSQSIPGTESINGGIGGIGTHKQLELMEKWLPTMKPQVVVLAWFNNDLINLIREQRRTGAKKHLLPRSYLYLFLAGRMERLKDKMNENRAMFRKYKLLYSPFFTGSDTHAEIAGALAETENLFAQMNALCQKHGARFAVFTIPNSVSFSEITNKKIYLSIIQALGVKLEDFRPGRPYFLIAGTCEKGKIPCYPYLYVDFKNVLKDRTPLTEDTRRLLYFSSDPHWNEKGCALAAKSVGDWLVRDGIIEAPGAKQKDAP